MSKQMTAEANFIIVEEMNILRLNCDRYCGILSLINESEQLSLDNEEHE